jgi:F0F1-type ATP synthase assembly protein I
MDDNLIEQKEPKERFVVKKLIRVLALILLYSTVLVQATVTNIFNTANSNIRAALRITEKTHSIFTFLYHVGQFLSAICVILIMRRPQRKGTVFFSIFTTFFAVALFQFTDNQIIIMPIYFFTGFCNMAINVYICLWIDQLSLFSFKSIFLSLTNLARAIGIAFGIYLNYYFGADNFKKSFLVTCFLLGLIGVGVSQIPDVYFSSNLLIYKGRFGEEKFKWKAKTQAEDEQSQSGGEESIYRYRHSGISTKDTYLLEMIYGLAKNQRYVCGLISNIILAIATSGLSNFSMGYINSYFNDPSVNEAWRITKNKILFTIIAPFIAFVLIGIISFFVGNYYSKTTPAIMFCFYLLTAICGNLIPSLKNNSHFFLCTLLYNIGSSGMGPYLQGTNLSAGTPSRKPYGVTVAVISVTLLGAVPAPYIYASILKSFPKEDVLRIFMRFLIVGAIFNFLMMIFRYKEYPKKQEKKPEIELIDK